MILHKLGCLLLGHLWSDIVGGNYAFTTGTRGDMVVIDRCWRCKRARVKYLRLDFEERIKDYVFKPWNGEEFICR